MDSTVGVPLISPVDESMNIPVGRFGWTSQEVTVPPSADGVTAVMPVPFVSTNELGSYSTSEGITSLTVMSTVAVALPPVLFA